MFLLLPISQKSIFSVGLYRASDEFNGWLATPRSTFQIVKNKKNIMNHLQDCAILKLYFNCLIAKTMIYDCIITEFPRMYFRFILQTIFLTLNWKDKTIILSRADALSLGISSTSK